MAYSVAVTSGKGGVGKTSIAINLGMTLSPGGSACLLTRYGFWSGKRPYPAGRESRENN